MLFRSELSKRRLRSEYLVCQSVVIEALGRVGNFFYKNSDVDKNIMVKLRNIDWNREAKIWKKRCVKENQRMVKSNEAVCLTANMIKIHLGISLNEEDKLKEKRHKRR